MRQVPEPIAAALVAGATTLCTAFILRRSDGHVMGFTDHDRPLSVNGVACQAASGWTPGAADAELGGKPGQAAALGVLSSDALSEADIAAGLYDLAALEIWRVDWTSPAAALLIFRGRLAKFTRQGASLSVEVEGPLAALEITAGRSYQRLCDATLGDARCGVNLADPRYAGQTCDFTWRTCQTRFNNLLNFQGFPDLPGDDFLAVVAADSPLNTGGSRR